MGTKVTIRLLQDSLEDMAALQCVLESAPNYAERITGAPPGAADSQSLFTLLGVVMTNSDVTAFWRKLGFSETGEMHPHDHGSVHSRIVIMEKWLRS